MHSKSVITMEATILEAFKKLYKDAHVDWETLDHPLNPHHSAYIHFKAGFMESYNAAQNWKPTSNILTILKEALIGKELRVCVSSKLITQPRTKFLRIPGATKTQFENNPNRFGQKKTDWVHLGYHRIYETHIVLNIICSDDYEGTTYTAILSDGMRAELRSDDYIPFAYKS